MSKILYDCIIIGGGPAGLAAAIYAGRAELKTLRIEKGFPGGQVLNTYEVDNYPGLKGLDGTSLAMKFTEHSQQYGVEEVTAEVLRLEAADEPVKRVITDKETYETKTIIVATGSGYRKLNVAGERELAGHGVSYCATCDGGFFRGKDVVVVGGGDVAVEDAIYLTRMCNHVYIVHRRDAFRAAGILSRQAKENEKITILWNTQVEKIVGEDAVEGVILCEKNQNENYRLAVDGVFIAVGMNPNSELLAPWVRLENGFAVCDDYMETSLPGVFAAGDIRIKPLRQVITAAADGAVAISGVQRYIDKMFTIYSKIV